MLNLLYCGLLFCSIGVGLYYYVETLQSIIIILDDFKKEDEEDEIFLEPSQARNSFEIFKDLAREEEKEEDEYYEDVFELPETFSQTWGKAEIHIRHNIQSLSIEHAFLRWEKEAINKKWEVSSKGFAGYLNECETIATEYALSFEDHLVWRTCFPTTNINEMFMSQDFKNYGKLS